MSHNDLKPEMDIVAPSPISLYSAVPMPTLLRGNIANVVVIGVHVICVVLCAVLYL